jgi:hypothetical protein
MTKPAGRLRRTGKLLYSMALIGTLTYGGWCWARLNRDFWEKLLDLSPSVMGTVAIASALLVPWLDRLDERIKSIGRPWLLWSVFSRNINFIPMDYPLFRVPFIVLLYFNLPVLAWIEEMVFRHNWVVHPTSGFLDAAWRSVIFGALHVVGGAKTGSVLPLTLAGMWLSWHYLHGGVQMATIAHLSFNATSLTLMLYTWARTGKNPFAA